MSLAVVAVIVVVSAVDMIINRRLACWQRRLIEEQRTHIETLADTIIMLEAHVALLEDRQP